MNADSCVPQLSALYKQAPLFVCLARLHKKSLYIEVDADLLSFSTIASACSYLDWLFCQVL